MPEMLLESDLLPTVFQCSCAALHIQHKEAGRSVTHFFEMLLSLHILASGKRCARAEQVMQIYTVRPCIAESSSCHALVTLKPRMCSFVGPCLSVTDSLFACSLLSQSTYQMMLGISCIM